MSFRSSEEDLRAIFLAFGRVQTCIVNVDKRHAFVKMITRDEAMAAKDGMEHYKSPEMQLRVRSVTQSTFSHLFEFWLTNILRLAGVSDLDLAIAVITRLVLASSQLSA